jgi:hypothetical protein
LYAEYFWSYVAAIRRAPLSRVDRRECYFHLSHWMAGRAPQVVIQPLSRRAFAMEPLPLPNADTARGGANP